MNKFLRLILISVIAFPIGVVLHNLVSGALGIEEPVFFFLALIICPLAFVIGVLGTIFFFIQERKRGKKENG